MSKFWRNWLRAWCMLVGLFGLVLVAIGMDATRRPAQVILSVLMSGGGQTDDLQFHFSTALLGCVTLGWSITLFAALNAAHQLQTRGCSTWRWIATSFLIWFTFDSWISIKFGFGLNAVSNSLFAIGFVLPFWRSGVLYRSQSPERYNVA